MSTPEQKPEDAYDASVLVIALSEALLRARKALAETEALCEDLSGAIRFTMKEQCGKLSLKTPYMKIELTPREYTRCTCCGEAPWDCANVKDGQAVTLEFYQGERYVKVRDLRTLKAVES